MRIFSEMRTLLLNPSEQGQKDRAELAANAGLTKGIAGVGSLVLGGVTVISVLAMQRFPLIGGVIALTSGLGAAAAHEVKVLSENTETMFSGDGVCGNAVNRASGAFSETNFTNAFTKDTWIVGPYFGSTIVRELQKAK